MFRRGPFGRHPFGRVHVRRPVVEPAPECEEHHVEVHYAGPDRFFRERHRHGPGPWPRGPFGHRPPFGFSPKGDRPFDRPFRGRGPFGGDPFDEDDGGRRRHRRGDLKYALLELLGEQPRHGYKLIKLLEQRYGGFYRPSPGSVYPTLQLLEDEGSATSESVEGKRVYTITDQGRQQLEELRQRGDRPGRHREGGRGVSDELEALRRSAMALQESIMQVARHGTLEQQRAALAQLDATRREIYRILAQGETEHLA